MQIKHLIIILALLSFRHAVLAQLENIPLVTVSGEAVIAVLPDHAIITVPVRRNLARNDISQIIGSTVFQRENNQIKMVGVKDTSIIASIEQILFDGEFTVFVKEFILKVNDIKNIPDIYVELVRRGFKEFEVSYRASAIVELKQKLLQTAVQNAQRKAEAMVEPFGQAIGKIHSITEQSDPAVNWYSRHFHPDEEIVIEAYAFNPGLISIPCRVVVSFDLIK
ncbi:MAG: SIMPL domain-containing protein [Cytophagaceae bacterium]